MPLAVTFYDTVNAVHVMAVVAAFGVLLAAPVLGPSAVLHRSWMAVLTPGAVLAFLTGAYMASDRSLWAEVWVTVPMTILFVVLGVVHAVVVPAERKLLGGDASAEGRWRAAVVASGVLVLVAVFFMVTKPGA